MIECKTKLVGHQSIAYFECGKGPLVIFLHGFPDTAETWSAFLPAFAAQEFRAVAPYLRGYPPSGPSESNDYHMVSIASDVLALIEALGEQQAIVVGHDWGALAAYLAANLAPQRVAKLITLAIPHPRALAPSPKLLYRARHFLAFQLPGASARVRANHFAAVDALYRRWSPNWNPSANDLEPVKRCFAVAGAVEAALAYYRTYARDAWRPSVRRIVLQKCSVPTLAIFGKCDGALAASDFKRAGGCFTDRYEELAVPRAGHFVHREAPDLVCSAMLKFVSR